MTSRKCLVYPEFLVKSVSIKWTRVYIDLYLVVAPHVNKEFWQQFQNYAPPSLRVIRTKFARTIIYIYNNIYAILN